MLNFSNMCFSSNKKINAYFANRICSGPIPAQEKQLVSVHNIT